MATEEGEYLVLEKPTFTGWNVVDLHTKERRNLELIKDMTEMRYVGRLHNQTEDGIHIIDDEDQIIFLEKGAYNKRIFFTTQANYHEDSVFVVNVPRSKHGEPACVKAKQEELRQYENLGAFEVIDISEAESEVIKILLTLAVSQGWEIRTCDVEKAFLQSDEM